jgi:N-acetylmuramoyl-L-alanine amidase
VGIVRNFFLIKVNFLKIVVYSLISILICAIIVTVMLTINKAQSINSVGTNKRDYNYTVIIDPGHGGVDGGAVGVDGVIEKGINLSISLKLRTFFEQAGFKVIMTREDDISIHDDNSNTIRKQKKSDLYNRLDIIDNNPRAIFISIHQNIFEDSKYSGTQVFYSKNNDASELLATTLQNNIKSMLQPQNSREIKKADKNLFLLYNAKSPCVLVECGFLSNAKEAAVLQNNDYQNKMAFAIFYGTLLFYDSYDTAKLTF